MTAALKYWNGTAWVTVASVNLMQVGGAANPAANPIDILSQDDLVAEVFTTSPETVTIVLT